MFPSDMFVKLCTRPDSMVTGAQAVSGGLVGVDDDCVDDLAPVHGSYGSWMALRPSALMASQLLPGSPLLLQDPDAALESAATGPGLELA